MHFLLNYINWYNPLSSKDKIYAANSLKRAVVLGLVKLIALQWMRRQPLLEAKPLLLELKQGLQKTSLTKFEHLVDYKEVLKFEKMAQEPDDYFDT